MKTHILYVVSSLRREATTRRLALLLAGPALSLPNMLVIRSVLGTTRTLVYVLLVVVMATLSGLIFGALCG